MTTTAARYEQVTTTPMDGWLSSSLYHDRYDSAWRPEADLGSVTYGNQWKRSLRSLIQEWPSNQQENEIDPFAAQYALWFLNLLPEDTPLPTVVVEDDGEVAFDWHRNARSTFSVSVGRDGTLRFAGLFGHRTRSGTDQLVGSIPRDILASIAQVVR